MENNALSKRSIGFGLALALACILNSLIVVVKEKSDVVMNGMKKITGHHWTTHSAVIILLFILLGVCFRGVEMSARRLIRVVISAVAVATLIIAGFYLFID